MTVSSVSSTSTSTTSSSSSASSTTQLAENFDTFLTMLTTQLKNQDPLSPMDSTEFTNQLVQFSAVEQQINTNSNLETLIAATQTGLKAQAISYIGNTIEVGGSSLPLQNGSASFSYTLGEEAQSISVVIKDSSGAVVANLTASGTAGRHEMTWDGLNSDGVAQEDGAYEIVVAATNSDGDAVDVTTTVYGRVTDVASDSDETLIAMGDVVATVDDVLTVRETSSTTTE